MPSDEKPHGTLAAGCPIVLMGCVNGTKLQPLRLAFALPPITCGYSCTGNAVVAIVGESKKIVVVEYIGELVHHAIARAHSLDEIACAVLLAVLDSHPPVPSQRIGGIIQQMPLRDEYIGAEEHPPCLKRAFQRQIAILHRATQALEHSRRACTHLDDFRVNARIAVIRTPRDTQPTDIRIQRANEVGHRCAQR